MKKSKDCACGFKAFLISGRSEMEHGVFCSFTFSDRALLKLDLRLSLSFCLSVCLSDSVCLCISLPACLFVYVSAGLSLSVFLSSCLCLTAGLSLSISFLSISVHIFQSLSLVRTASRYLVLFLSFFLSLFLAAFVPLFAPFYLITSLIKSKTLIFLFLFLPSPPPPPLTAIMLSTYDVSRQLVCYTNEEHT